MRHNPLLERTEFEFEVSHESEPTPSTEDLRERVSAEHDFPEDGIEVVGIYKSYGRESSVAKLNVYGDIDLESYEEFEEEPEAQEDVSETSSTTDYDSIVSGTISDAKDELSSLENPDFEAALAAEEDNKNRKTFIEWLESQ